MTDREEIQRYQLSNGITIVHRQVPHTKIAHVGFVLDIGSRDEQPGQEGMAHFWEHMAFKGTRTRKSFHIIQSLESVGGELNAYTTKEKVCFYASVLSSYFPRAFELLADITFHSIFPEREIDKERSVILEEMSLYEDNPEDAIHDEFDEIIFGSHPLGTNILGHRSQVERFNREDFLRFISEHLNTGRIVVAVVGPVDFRKVKQLAERFLAEVPGVFPLRKRERFTGYRPRQVERQREGLLSHTIAGAEAPSVNDKDRLPYFMLVNLLAGVGMNSRLNLSLREKYGLVYSVESNYTPYLDTGSFSIYFASEPQNQSRCFEIMEREIKKLIDQPLGSLQLHHARRQLKGQLAMAEESNVNFMLMMGKSLLDSGRIESLQALFDEIDQITAPVLQYTAARYLPAERLSTLIYKP